MTLSIRTMRELEADDHVRAYHSCFQSQLATRIFMQPLLVSKHHIAFVCSAGLCCDLKDLPLEFPDGTTPIASRVCLFSTSGTSWKKATVPPLSKVIAENNASNRTYGKPGRREVEEVKAQVNRSEWIKEK